MRDILAPASRKALLRFAAPDTLFGFDFDGTLAPIVSDPARARLRARTRGLLRGLARSRRCVVVSGRQLRDLRPRLRGIPFAIVVGNHGIEPFGASAALARRVAAWRRSLRGLEGLPGVVVEDKTYSLTVHYRGAPRRRSAVHAIGRALQRLRSARVTHGKLVFNVLPRRGPDKGQALERARRRLKCRRALFVGDDATDEDVFSRPHGNGLLAIRVGRRRSSHAAYFVSNQGRVDALLRLLLRLSGR